MSGGGRGISHGGIVERCRRAVMGELMFKFGLNETEYINIDINERWSQPGRRIPLNPVYVPMVRKNFVQMLSEDALRASPRVKCLVVTESLRYLDMAEKCRSAENLTTGHVPVA
jgi:hypothetical protein